MLRLERHSDDAAMTALLCTYFEELGAPDIDADSIEQEFLHDPDVRVFRILENAEMGFVVIEGYPELTELCEFYIAPEYRRRGVGTRAAHLAFDLCPGAWRLGTLHDAIHFWRHALKTCPLARDVVEGPSPIPHQTHRVHFTIGPRT